MALAFLVGILVGAVGVILIEAILYYNEESKRRGW